MKKKVLLPTDFSSCAWNAISYAIEIYKEEVCEFYLLSTFKAGGYVGDRYAVSGIGDSNYDAAKMKCDEELLNVRDKIESSFDSNSNHTFITVSQMNSVVEGIQNTVEKFNIDIVIMGTKGVSNSFEVIYGTNTVDVMENVRQCPVLAVPDEASIKKPSKIVFPIDFTIPINKNELSYLKNIADGTDAFINFLHVISSRLKLDKDQENNKGLIKEYFDNIKYQFTTLIHDDFHEALSEFTKEEGAELIVFINQRHGFLNNILSKPLVKKLGYTSKIPVMALHDK